MIKKIIFDLDDTLILFDDKIFESLVETFNELKIKYNDDMIIKIKEAISSYELHYDYYNKQYFKEHINKYLETKLSDIFIDVWLYYLGKIEPFNIKYNEEVKNTLEYLKNNYELIVLTNWFASSQIGRLKEAELFDYFSCIIGTEYVKNKPNQEAFIEAVRNNKIEECIMIGDSISKDIEGASNIGMDTILCDPYDKYKTYTKKKIVKFSELKEML